MTRRETFGEEALALPGFPSGLAYTKHGRINTWPHVGNVRPLLVALSRGTKLERPSACPHPCLPPFARQEWLEVIGLAQELFDSLENLPTATARICLI